MNATFDDDVVGRVRASLSAVAASTPIGPDRWNAVVDVSAHRQRTFAASFAVAASAAVVVGAAGAIAVAQHGGSSPQGVALADPSPSPSASLLPLPTGFGSPGPGCGGGGGVGPATSTEAPRPTDSCAVVSRFATLEERRDLTYVLDAVPKGLHVANAGATVRMYANGDRKHWQIVYAPDSASAKGGISIFVESALPSWTLPTQYPGVESVSIHGHPAYLSLTEGPDVGWRVGDVMVQVTVENGTRQQLIDAANAVVLVPPDDPRAAPVIPTSGIA